MAPGIVFVLCGASLLPAVYCVYCDWRLGHPRVCPCIPAAFFGVLLIIAGSYLIASHL